MNSPAYKPCGEEPTERTPSGLDSTEPRLLIFRHGETHGPPSSDLLEGDAGGSLRSWGTLRRTNTGNANGSQGRPHIKARCEVVVLIKTIQ